MSCTSLLTQFLPAIGGATEPHSMELAQEVVSLVARLGAECPEYDFSILQSSTDARLMYIEACRQSLESPKSRAKRNRMHHAWARLDFDQVWEIEELTFRQTDTDRVKSLFSLASRGEFYPTSQFVTELARPKSEPLERRSCLASSRFSSRSHSRSSSAGQRPVRYQSARSGFQRDASARPRQRTVISL